MSTQRSVGANRFHDDHPQDFASRERLRVQIVAGLEDRRRRGIPLYQQSSDMGRSRSFIAVPYHPERHHTSLWKWSQTYELCLAAHLTPRIVLHDIAGMSSMWDLGQRMPVYLGAGAMEVLRDFRRGQEITLRALAEQMDLARSAVFKAESSADPRLSTIQRYARALGGRVTFSARMR